MRMINHRTIGAFLKNNLPRIIQQFEGEMQDAITLAAIGDAVNKILADNYVFANDINVTCDYTTNPPEFVDHNIIGLVVEYRSEYKATFKICFDHDGIEIELEEKSTPGRIKQNEETGKSP